MSMVNLARKYLSEITIQSFDFVVIDNSNVDYDAAYLALGIPRAMLREYSRFRNGTEKYPDPVEFWKETNLVEMLKRSNKHQDGVFLDEVLHYLNSDDVRVKYEKGINSKTKRLTVLEVVPTT